MTKSLILFIFLAAFMALPSAMASSQAANDQAAPAADRAVDDLEGAIAFIEHLSDQTIAVWSDATFSATDRSAAIKDLFLGAVDVRYLSRVMLGRHIRSASRAETEEYLAVMTDYIVGEFNKRMMQIGFKTLNIIGTSPAPGKRGHVFVKTRVIRDEGEPIIAEWRVRKKDGVFQIVNLELEGINLVITNREYFSERIKALGGLPGLIEELRTQTVAP